jgi:hypothetical protein
MLPPAERPDELHLCGGAITESSAKPFLEAGLSRVCTFQYWTDRDYLLYYLFKLISFGETPIGAKRLDPREYDNLVTVQVCNFFDFFVHNRYGTMWHKFAQSTRMMNPKLTHDISVDVKDQH